MIETIRTAINELVLDRKQVPTATPIQPKWDETRKMRCLVWKGKEDIRYVEHARPCITAPTDLLLKVTATSICGSDLHLYKGTFLGMRDGDIPGHEFLGTIEEVGDEVKNFKVGQRVIVGFCITCGECDFCKREEYTACEKTNPTRTVELFYGDRPTGAYGYSHMTGAAPGGQSEYVRVAFADWNCLPIPDDLPDEKALYLTDIIPTGYHGTVLGDVGQDSVVGIWGLGPIGLMCAQWCRVLGAKRIIGIDAVPERLALARDVLKVDVIDFGKEDVVNRVHEMLGGSLDVAIDCVGFDFPKSWLHKLQMKLGLETDSPEVFTEMFRCVRKFGKVAVIGDYYLYANKFPIGALMEKGLTVRGSQCPVQKYWKFCLEKLQEGVVDPSFLVTDRGTLADGPRFYKKMAEQEGGCIKTFLRPEHLPVE